MIITKLPPESDICPVNLGGSEVLILSLLEVAVLKVALPQVLVDIVPQALLDLLAALPGEEEWRLRDLHEAVPGLLLLVVQHQFEAGVVELQQAGLLGLPGLHLDLLGVSVRLTARLVQGADLQHSAQISLLHFTCSNFC